MKGFFAFILCLLILGLTFQDTITYVTWKVNQDYISKNLCLEKGQATSTCKGKCQLQEQFSESRNTESNKTPNFQEERLLVVYLPSLLNQEFSITYFHRSNPYLYKEKYSYLIQTQIFHPPQV